MNQILREVDSITEVAPATLRELDDDRLVMLRRDFSVSWDAHKGGTALPEGLNREEFLNRFLFLVREAERRGLTFTMNDALSRAARRLSEAEPHHNTDEGALKRLTDGLPDEVMLVDDFVRFGGPHLTEADGPVHILVDDCFKDSSRDLKLFRMAKSVTRREAEFCLCPDGFPDGALPGYDLVLRRSRGAVNVIDEPDFQDRIYGAEVVEAVTLAERQENLKDGLVDFVVVPGFVSVTGSYLYHVPEREARDLDIVVKSSAENEDVMKGLEARIIEATGKTLHWVWEPRGPNWSFVPLYDLVCRVSSAHITEQEITRALKVPDPAFIIGRLKAGKEALLLSGVSRAGLQRILWVLVNERIKADEPVRAWAEVRFAQEAVTVKSLKELGDRADGLDNISRREFAERRGPFWILKLRLVKAFPKPVELKEPPEGRRFGGQFDLEQHRLEENFHLRDIHWVPVPESGTCPTTHPEKLKFPGTETLRCFRSSAARVVRSMQEAVEAPVNKLGLNVAQTIERVQKMGRKLTKAEASFVGRSPSPTIVCGSCRFYLRSPDSEVGACQVVEGPIPWFATSNAYISAQSEAVFSFGVQSAKEAVRKLPFNNFFVVEGGRAKDLGNDPPKGLTPFGALLPREWVLVAEDRKKGSNKATLLGGGVKTQEEAEQAARAFIEREMDKDVVAIIGTAVGKLEGQTVFRDRAGFRFTEQHLDEKPNAVLIEAIKPGTFFLPQKPAVGFREPKGRTEAWEEFVKPALDAGQRVSVELKGDGVRLTLHRLGGAGSEVRIFTEKKGLERSKFLPALTKAISGLPGGAIILDSENIELSGGKPGIRREFGPRIAVQTDEPVASPIRSLVFDILHSNGRDLTGLDYAERLAELKRRLPRKVGPLTPLARTEVRTRAQYDKAVDAVEEIDGSEGAMLKLLTGPLSRYAVETARSRGLAKLKIVSSVSCLVIGMRKQPASFADAGVKQPAVPVSGARALALWRRLIKNEQTFIFRCAVRNDKNELQELNSRSKYTPDDLELRWVPAGATDPLTGRENTGARGEWRGTDAPAVWEMASGWPQAKLGAYQYAKTFAVRLEPQPKLGRDLIEVEVGEIQEWKDEEGRTRFSWTFPAPVETVQERRPPDSVAGLRQAARFVSDIK